MPHGKYAVFAYVWEETDPASFSIRLDEKVVELDHNSGTAGCWRRLGSWIAEVAQGEFAVSANGGTASFSGLEIWRKTN